VRISAPAVVATEQIKIDKTTTVKNVQGEVEAREITISKERLCAAPRNASDSICRLKNHKLNLSKISVDMKINISESGDVTGVEVEKVRGGDFVLRVDTYQNQISQAAKDAAAKYKFIPFEKDDVRVKAEGHITLPVPFTINNMTRDDWETQCAKSKSVGNDREAVDCYSKAIDADPDFWQAYANRANSLLKIKEYQAALSDVDKVILINPSYGNAYNSKGAIYYYMKDYEKAVENFTRSIEMNPKSAMQYANRAASYSNLKKNDLALKDLDSAVDIDSDYAFTYYVRSCVFAEQGKIDKACDSLKKGVKKGLVVTDELKNDKSWDNLRNEECYKKIMNR
jgi:tetratricopeptide (TPR) repeat protein